MGLLGLAHVERNGHHYFRGLSMWPQDWGKAMLDKHPDLYCKKEHLVRLQVADGRLDLGSINGAPFGLLPLFDPPAAGIKSMHFT